MAQLERGERLQIMLSADELEAVENWRFEKRMPSRAAAVRELLRRGLSADGFLAAETGSKSQDFGILESSHGNGGGRDGSSPGEYLPPRGN
jgi:antitoxin component HigA of HigAB toxin-antitoxin module